MVEDLLWDELVDASDWAELTELKPVVEEVVSVEVNTALIVVETVSVDGLVEEVIDEDEIEISVLAELSDDEALLLNEVDSVKVDVSEVKYRSVLMSVGFVLVDNSIDE